MRSQKCGSIGFAVAIACGVVFGLHQIGTVAAEPLPKKVEVCHQPPGNPDNWHTILISTNALDTHLAHGDFEGGCNLAEEILCDDGDACTQDLFAEGTEACQEPHPAVNCDDSDPTTADSCDSTIGCVHEPSTPPAS